MNLSSLWRLYLSGEQNALSLRTLQNWYSRGTKLARLAAGGANVCAVRVPLCIDHYLGSIYMLLWLAYTNLHGPFVQADGTLAMDIANILRSPDPGKPSASC